MTTVLLIAEDPVLRAAWTEAARAAGFEVRGVPALLPGVHPLGNLEPEVARDERREAAGHAVSLRTGAPAELEHVAEALGGDEPGPRQPTLEHGVGGGRGAVDDQVVTIEDHQEPADEDGHCRAFGEPRCRPIGGGRAVKTRGWPLRRCSGRCVIHATTVLAAAGEPQYNSDVQNNPSSKSPRKPVQKRPTYSIEAVDNALQLLQLLRDGGTLRLKDAAEELGVAPSTAHRLLAMLVYRGSPTGLALRPQISVQIGSPIFGSWIEMGMGLGDLDLDGHGDVLVTDRDNEGSYLGYYLAYGGEGNEFRADAVWSGPPSPGFSIGQARVGLVAHLEGDLAGDLAGPGGWPSC